MSSPELLSPPSRSGLLFPFVSFGPLDVAALVSGENDASPATCELSQSMEELGVGSSMDASSSDAASAVCPSAIAASSASSSAQTA